MIIAWSNRYLNLLIACHNLDQLSQFSYSGNAMHRYD